MGNLSNKRHLDVWLAEFFFAKNVTFLFIRKIDAVG
jgi:hypothetical protein